MDTAMTLNAMHPDLIVIETSRPKVLPNLLSQKVNCASYKCLAMADRETSYHKHY